MWSLEKLARLAGAGDAGGGWNRSLMTTRSPSMNPNGDEDSREASTTAWSVVRECVRGAGGRGEMKMEGGGDQGGLVLGLVLYVIGGVADFLEGVRVGSRRWRWGIGWCIQWVVVGW